EIYNPKVIQASMGAFLRVPFFEMSFANLVQQFPNIPTYATVMNGQSIHELQQYSKGIIILGNEGKGIDSEIITKSDYQISIPRYGKSRMESLNVGVAAGIITAILKRN
ncbi:MAG: TrmH family RNA methyltransferase, partial [Bacteroidota bacterium]